MPANLCLLSDLTFQNCLGEPLIHSPTPPLSLSSAATPLSFWGWMSEAMPHLHMQEPKLDPGWTWDSTSPLMTEDVTKQGTGNDGKCHRAYLERNLMGVRAQP